MKRDEYNHQRKLAKNARAVLLTADKPAPSTTRRRPEREGYQPRRVIAYVRCSTKRQAEGDAASPQQQEQAIRQWAKLHGAVIVSWFYDLGVSGRTPPGNRPGLVAAVAAVQAARPRVDLVVAKRDRLSRIALFAGLIEHDLAKMGATVVATDAGSTGDTITDKLVKTILDGVAEHSVSLAGARISAAMMLKREAGMQASRPAYGMRLSSKYNPETGYRVLEKNPAEQRVIETMRKLRARGNSYAAIAQSLNEADIPTQRVVKGKPGNWVSATVGRILARAGVPTPKAFKNYGGRRPTGLATSLEAR